MADATLPTSRMDQMDAPFVPPNDTNTTTAADPRFSDYFDFDSFSNDVPPDHQGPYKTGYCYQDEETTEDYIASENAPNLPDFSMYDGSYNETVANSGPDETLANGEEDPDQDYSDEDDEAALAQAAVESYYNNNPLHSWLVPRPPIDTEEQLADPHLEQSPTLEALRGNEKWHVDKESAEFLASVVSLTSDHDLGEILQRSTRNPLRKLKLEEPVVDTHTEMSMIKLFKRNEVSLSNDGIEPFPLDVEKGESLEWPKEARELPKKLHGDMMNSRWEVDAETREYLKEIYKGPKVDLDDWLKQDRERRLPPPPLSPRLVRLSPPYSPAEIDAEAAEVELTSSPADPSAHENDALTARILRRDDQQMQKGADEAVGLWNDFAESSSSPLKRKVMRLDNLKVSSPLLPFEHEEPPVKKAKTVAFDDDLGKLIPRPSDDKSIDTGELAEELRATFNPLAGSAGAEMQRRVQDEELVEADTTLRITAPTVDAITVIPPWEVHLNGNGNVRDLDSQRKLIDEAVESLTSSETKWSGASKLKDSLHWMPFPSHLGKMKPEGDFDDGSMARYLEGLDINTDVDLERLIWKPEGLRVLDCDEDEDDELEAAEFSSDIEKSESDADEPHETPVTSMTPPLRQQAAAVTAVNAAPPLKQPSAPSAQSKAKHDTQSWTPMDELLQKRKIQLEEDKSAFSNASGLDFFAKVQGLSAGATTKQHPQHVANSQQPAEMPPAHEVADNTFASSKSNVVIPVPTIQLPSKPLQLIISFTLMKNHHFVRRLQKLFPSVELIDRDFEAITSDKSGKAAQREADLTISPSTGIMFTNLQKLKQKPLPGQSSSFGIREQIASVAARYERIMVLVSDRPMSADSQGHIENIDSRDSAAIADLIKQTAVLETEIQVVYAAGGMDNLVKWTAAAISRSASAEHKLLGDETLWERFLRKAGLNSYAAQVVLGSMKPAESSEVSASGLAAFVMMNAEQRVQRFGPMMGGDGLLRRVSRMLDGKWMAS